MAYQTKIPAAVLNTVRAQTSATERRFRFDRVEAIYGIAETLGIAAAAFFAALIYWQTSYGWVPPFWKLLAPSILISVLVGTITVFGDRIRQVLVPGPAFLSSAIRTSLESFSILI
jgi:hypothetical protein